MANETGSLKSSIDPFETIESAQSFVTLLAEAVSQAKQELEIDVRRESSLSESRRLDALRIALYSVDKLEAHMNRSGRILNDLRTLRRLLFQERGTPITPITRSSAPEPLAREAVNAENGARKSTGRSLAA